MTLKAILTGLGGVLGTGTAVTTGLYVHTSEIMWEKVKDKAIPADAIHNSVWQKIRSKFSEKKDLSDSVFDVIKEDSSGDKVKEWCFESYGTLFRNLFTKEKLSLLRDVEKLCTLTIKEYIDVTKILKVENEDEEDKEIFKTNLEILKSYSDSVESVQELSSLKKEISDIEISEDDEKWKKLRSWCKEAYGLFFRGEQEDIWKLTGKFCKKPD